jgi:hypothetical protein
MEMAQKNKSPAPMYSKPKYIECDTAPSKDRFFAQFERKFALHNFTNHTLYVRDLRDFVSVVEPEPTLSPRHTTIGPHITTVEAYTIRGVDAVRLSALLTEQFSKNNGINPVFARAFKDCYDGRIKEMQDRYGQHLDPSRIKNMTLCFSVMCTYTLDALRRNVSTYCKEAGLVMGFSEEAIAHVYPNSECLSRTKDFTNSQFYRDEVYGSIRLVDNHNEIGDQYIWLLNGVRHIPAVKDGSVESGFYIVEPRACTGEVVHSATRYDFKDAYRLFHIRSTQKEATEAGNPLVSEEVAVKTIEKETKVLSAQQKKEEVVDSSLKSMIERFIRTQSLHDESDRIKNETKLREEKLQLEKEERERKALYEKRRMEMDEEERRRKAEFDDSERRRKAEAEEAERQRKIYAEDLERRIKLEFEQRRVELDRISQLNKMNTEKRLNRNKERSEKTKIFGDFMKAAPAIILGALGVFAIFRSRSA